MLSSGQMAGLERGDVSTHDDVSSRLGAQVTVPRAGSYVFHLEAWDLARDADSYTS